MNTTLSLNNFNQTLNSLAGPGTVQLGSAQLTLATAGAPQTFGGAITGTGGVTVAGTGSLTLNGAQTYTGATKYRAEHWWSRVLSCLRPCR